MFQISAYLNLSLAMIIVGSSVVFGKIITEAFPVFLASGLRFSIASLAMIPFLVRSRSRLMAIHHREYIKIMAMAVAGQFVFTFLLLLGLRYTSGIEAGIITSTSPAFMAVMSWVFFREKTSRRQFSGILLVITGMVVINVWPLLTRSTLSGFHIWGNLLILGAVLGEAVFLLMRKQIDPDISDMELTGLLCLAGLILFLPFSLWQAVSFDFTSVNADAWVSMAYFGAIFTVLAYLFWFKGVSRVSGNIAGAFTAIMPVSATLLSILFLDESLTLASTIGGVMIIGSIFMMCLPSKREGAWKSEEQPAA